jgi:hypothetical protein
MHGFAWVDRTDATFSEDFLREDEKVFSLKIEHNEGEAATATVEIKNPGVGLLAPGRKAWAWISWQDDDTAGTIHPLFFGQLVAIPSDLFKTVITITLIARPIDLAARKLALAQTLKVAPYFDAEWVAAEHRNDPDTVLEGYSRRWHIDRVSHAVTTSDIILGEDGTESFGEDESFYDDVSLTFDKTPLGSVGVTATVKWKQRASGTVFMGYQNIRTYTGDGLINEWPRPYAQIGSGWSAGAGCRVKDVLAVGATEPQQFSYSWQSHAKEHLDGDIISVSESGQKKPSNFVGYLAIVEDTSSIVAGWPSISVEVTPNDPSAPSKSDVYSGTAPSSSHTQRQAGLWQWTVATALELRYDADRDRTESLSFALAADVQDVIGAVSNIYETEQITISGHDVGTAIDVTALLSSTGDNVSDGETVTIGSTVYLFQETLTAGVGHVHKGATAAESLTNLANAINVNGSGLGGVDFAEENTANRAAVAVVLDDANVKLYSIADAQTTFVGTTASALRFHSPNTFTLEGSTNFSDNDTVTVGAHTYRMRIDLGTQFYNPSTNPFNFSQAIYYQVPYDVLIGNDAEGSLINLAAAINADGGIGSTYSNGTVQNVGSIAYAVDGKLIVTPRYSGSGLTVAESSPFTWRSEIDTLVPDADTVPIVDQSRRSYFPSARGLQSIEALICRARARLLLRSRCVKVSFRFPWWRALDLSCRKNAALYDERMPGGLVTGKVIAYSLSVNGDSGERYGTATIGAAVGNGGTVEAAAGAPSYALTDYVAGDYQYIEDAAVLTNTSDVAYTPPLDAPDDDGLVFPLDKRQITIGERIINNYVSQEDQITLEQDNFAHMGEDPRTRNMLAEKVARQVSVLQKTHTLYELTLRPVSGQSFTAQYDLALSQLAIPKQIDLAA